MFVTGDCNHGNEAAVACAPPEGQCVGEGYVKISDKQSPSYSNSGSFNVATSVTSAHKAN